MFEDILIAGFGVIGTEVLYQVVKKIDKRKLNISIMEKDYSNFPGGVAYSKSNSKHGFFNNPLRLSNDEFQNWVKKIENQKKLIEYFRSNEDLNLKNWLDKNVLGKFNKFKNINELYLPRSAYAMFLEEKFLNILKIMNIKKKIKISFYENELIKVSKDIKENRYLCYVKNNLKKMKLMTENNNLLLKKKLTKKERVIRTKNIILGLGILPPTYINSKKLSLSDNYIHDFYASGATNNFLKKIKKIKNLKKIIIVFIGNKAGLLETVQEIEKLEKKTLKRMQIISVSSSSLSLEKAILSKNYRSYDFKFLINKKISKIKMAKEILNLIKLEFQNGIKKKYSKYDIWTLILKKKILDKCFKKLSFKEKKAYNNLIFIKLRNITRYTYPETVEAKNRLEKLNILKNLNDKVSNLSFKNNKVIVKTKNKRVVIADLVINVSGPVSLFNNTNEVPCLNSLMKICNNFNERGFISNKFNLIGHNIYAPGTLSSNFNPERKTIIKSITENCITTATHLTDTIKGKKWN